MTGRFPDEVEVAIVGSGPAGSAYARILSELVPGARIAMLEVGPALGEPAGVHVKNLPDDEAARARTASEGPGPAEVAPWRPGAARVRREGTFLLDAEHAGGMPSAAMSACVGGMGAHWTGACPRPGGAERPPVDGLDELLDTAERLLGVTADPFADAPFADTVRARLAAAFDDGRPADRRVAAMPLAVQVGPEGVVWSGADVVLGEVTRENPDFGLYDEALVTRVLVEDEAATGVVVRDRRDGSEHTVSARHVVVAADALRTPQLLWASGVRPAALGRYLNDQPQIVFAVRLRDVEGRPPVTASAGVSWVPYTDEEPVHGQVMQLDASPIPFVAQDAAPGSIVGLGWFCAKDVREQDRVSFDDADLDAHGLPAVTIHYGYSDVDRARITAATDAVRRAADALGDPLDAEPIELSAGASLHYQGTVRLGATDDGTSVCDPTSQVWGVEHLRVAGNGVIGTEIAANPTLTALALAVAGARAIAADLARTLTGARPAQGA